MPVVNQLNVADHRAQAFEGNSPHLWRLPAYFFPIKSHRYRFNNRRPESIISEGYPNVWRGHPDVRNHG